MSTSTSRSSDSGYSAFNHHITNDSGVCNQCYARIYIEHEFNPALLRKSLRGVLTSDVERTQNAVTDYHPSLPAADCRRTGCANCGSSDRRITHRPVSTDTAKEYGQNLTERVEEHPELLIEDDDALVDEVERLKTSGDYDSRGNRVFQFAFDTVVTELTDE